MRASTVWGSFAEPSPLALAVTGHGSGVEPPPRKRLTDAQLITLIRSIHAEFKGAYGSPRMYEELRSRGLPTSKGRVERLMRDHGIRAKHKRRYKATTDSKHAMPVAPNLLDRTLYAICTE